jgi:hypothetical protein
MIRPLRDRHRWLVPLVALTTALLFAWAFEAYRAAPRDSLAPGSRLGAPVGRSVPEPRP